MGHKLFKNLMIATLLVVFCISSTLLVIYLLDYQKNKELYNESVEEFTDTNSENDPSEENPFFGLSEDQVAVVNTKVDFDALAAVNNEVVAWIIVPKTPINYPVLRGQSNQKYLTLAYDGSYNSLGSIFMDYRNSADLSDNNTIIYGHNTKNKSMFGSLNDFVNQDVFDAARYIYVFTPEKVAIYEIFSTYITDAYSDSYQLQFDGDDSYVDFLQKMQSQSLFKTGVELSGEDKIITLSTCTSSNDRLERIVVHGKLIVSL